MLGGIECTTRYSQTHVLFCTPRLRWCGISFFLGPRRCQDFLRRSSRTVERALGEAAALDILLDYAADEGDNSRGDQGQHLNEAMALHEVG